MSRRSRRWRPAISCIHHSFIHSFTRLIDSCITQLEAQGPSRTCNESEEEKEEDIRASHNFLHSSFVHSFIHSSHTRETSLVGVPREQGMLKGHLPTVIHYQVYYYTKILSSYPATTVVTRFPPKCRARSNPFAVQRFSIMHWATLDASDRAQIGRVPVEGS